MALSLSERGRRVQLSGPRTIKCGVVSDSLQPVHRLERALIYAEDLTLHVQPSPGFVHQPWRASVAYQEQGIRFPRFARPAHANSAICGEIRETFLQRAKDEDEVVHGRCGLRRT